MPTDTWSVNGKFLCQPVTGVQRTGRELLKALDRALSSHRHGRPCRLLVPEGAEVPPLSAIEVVVVRGPKSLHGWEQLALPRAASGHRLLSLCGSAPAYAQSQVNLLHDAAVFDVPQAYTWMFVAWYRWLFRHLARRGSMLLTVSEFSRQRLAAALGLAPERIGVLGHGSEHLDSVEPNLRVRSSLGLDAVPYLISVASRQRTKNEAAVIAAWERLRHPDARLVLVGRSNVSVFKHEVTRSAPSVIRLGAVDDAALKALLMGAHGLVFASSYEGFGLPPVEAMACGCPVLAAKSAAIPEVCGDAALYVDPLDQAALSLAMGKLLDDEPMRADLSMRGRRRAEHWRWDDCAARLLAHLDLPDAGNRAV